MKDPELTPEEALEKQREQEDWRERSSFTTPPICTEGLCLPEEEI